MSLANAVLRVAQSQLGEEEFPKGSNAGVSVEKYLRSVGLGKGYAWCMAFVYYCYKTAAAELGMKNPLYKTAGVLKEWRQRPDNQCKTPRVGSVFIMDFGHGRGHTGIVEKVLADGTIRTIEGNTNDDGSREGYEVARRIRKVSDCKGFLVFDPFSKV